jgi:site-specific recombinase XerD
MRVIGDMHRLTGGADQLASITVRQHAEAWLKAKENEVADSSMKFFRGSAQRFVDHLEEKADRCLFEITKSDIVAYRDSLAAEVSPSTVDHTMSTVKALFKSAVAEDLISDDPAEHVGPPWCLRGLRHPG